VQATASCMPREMNWGACTDDGTRETAKKPQGFDYQLPGRSRLAALLRSAHDARTQAGTFSMDILPRHYSTSRIENFIAHFERRGAQPDRWEGERLSRALAFLNAGDFDNCERELSLAETPVEGRPPQHVGTVPASYPLLTTAEHRANFERIKSRHEV
jgi:hypothetical protein